MPPVSDIFSIMTIMIIPNIFGELMSFIRSLLYLGRKDLLMAEGKGANLGEMIQHPCLMLLKITFTKDHLTFNALYAILILTVVSRPA
jgi:hypothetical protein